MKRHFPLYILPVFIWLISCRSSRSNPPISLDPIYQEETIMAWNEDTVFSYVIALTKQKKFYSTIIKRDSSKKVEEYYNGVFHFSKDTFFLTYYKRLQPK